MRKNKSLSIVIPAYNAAPYLEACLNTIAIHKHESIEIIIVNDGSTDGTALVADSFSEKHIDVRHIKIPNGGPANARNTGLQHAKGRYIYFVDADDKLRPNMISEVIGWINEEEFDIAIFGFNIVDPSGRVIANYSYSRNCTLMSKKELGKHLAKLYEGNLLNQAWNKVFRTEILRNNQIVFKDFKYGEDRLFVFETLKASTKIRLIDSRLYDYEAGFRESLVTKFYDRKLEVACLIDSSIRELAKLCGPISAGDKEIYDYMFIKSVVSCISNIFVKSSPLYFFQKKQYVEKIFSNAQVSKGLNSGFKRPLYFKLMVIILRSKQTYLILLMARVISLASHFSPKAFIKFKHEK